jgi:sortase B
MPNFDAAYARRRRRTKKKNGFVAVIVPKSGDSAAELVRKSVLIVSITALVASAVLLVDYYHFGYFGLFGSGDESFTANPHLRDVDRSNTATGTLSIIPSNLHGGNGGGYVSEPIQVEILEKYREFFEANDEFVGYLSLDPHINYPVVWRKHDNDFYLNHNFDRVRNANGTVFADGWGTFSHPTTVSTGRPDNIVIHGHNLRANALFHPLRNYVRRDTGFEFLSENHVVQFDTLFEHGTYKIFAVAQINVIESLGEVFPFWTKSHFNSEDDFFEYVIEMLDRSQFHTDVDLKYGDELLTLITCDFSMFNPGLRIVVVARRLRDGETADMNTDAFVNLRGENNGRNENGFMQYKMFESYYRMINSNNGWVGRHSRNWDTSRVSGLDEFFMRHPRFLTDS